MKYIGEIAALATAFFFSMTALIFTSTGRSVGSQVTNRLRLLIALLYLVVLNLVIFGEPLPFSAATSRWFWLALSGIIGLALGDAFLFQSFVSVGPRLGSLLLSLAPVFGSVIADRLGFTRARMGKVLFNGKDITHISAYKIVRLQIGLVPQGRRIFPSLTVKENLAIASRSSGAQAWDFEKVFALFPPLKERHHHRGNELSGGEQQYAGHCQGFDIQSHLSPDG